MSDEHPMVISYKVGASKLGDLILRRDRLDEEIDGLKAQLKALAGAIASHKQIEDAAKAASNT